MQLTSDMFEQVVKSLRSDSGGSGGRENRKSPRVGIRARSTILIPAKCGPRTLQVNVRDVSANGIGLLLPEPLLAPGEEFILVLPGGGQYPKRQLACEVCRSSRLSPNLYAVGARIKGEIAEQAPPPAKPATPKPAPAPAQQLRPGISALGVTQEMLNQADKAAISDLEQRLKKLSA